MKNWFFEIFHRLRCSWASGLTLVFICLSLFMIGGAGEILLQQWNFMIGRELHEGRALPPLSEAFHNLYLINSNAHGFFRSCFCFICFFITMFWACLLYRWQTFTISFLSGAAFLMAIFIFYIASILVVVLLPFVTIMGFMDKNGYTGTDFVVWLSDSFAVLTMAFIFFTFIRTAVKKQI